MAVGLRGETVIVKTFEATGDADEYNEATYTETLETVENVLVAPSTSQDIGEDRPLGAQKGFSLCFPKSYGRPLENAEVQVRGEWYRVVGSSDVYDPAICPTDWNMTAEVVTTHG